MWIVLSDYVRYLNHTRYTFQKQITVTAECAKITYAFYTI